MSTCLTSRTYGFDLEIVKPSSSSPRSSHSSSSSSTLSESSNSPLTISTRKPRTPRKRPNQTYTEAATLLSAINPNIFPTKNPTKIYKSTRFYNSFSESSELLPPFPALDNPGFLLHEYIPEKTVEKISTKPTFHSTNSCSNSTKTDVLQADCEDDFDAESILDEETEQGIDSIMGNLAVTNDIPCERSYTCYSEKTPIGLGFGSNFAWGFGAYRHVSALRRVPDNDWWRFPTVDVLEIFPKRKAEKKKVEETDNNSNSVKKPVPRLCLKLNYEEVQNAWSHNGSPFSDEISVRSRPDTIARLAQFDLLFPELYPFGEENEGIREASVFRYREKRRTRLFSKKIRYQVRKVNADRRPRMKGRFVRRPSLLHDKARDHLGSLVDEGCVKHHIPLNHSKSKQRRS